jgi:hypothetical protein
VKIYANNGMPRMNKPVIISPFSTLTGDELEIAAERAAIREFDGGQPREYAESQAAKEVAYMRAGRRIPDNLDLTIYR